MAVLGGALFLVSEVPLYSALSWLVKGNPLLIERLTVLDLFL